MKLRSAKVCKHSEMTDFHVDVTDFKKIDEFIVIKGISVITATCPQCEQEISMVATAGVLWNVGGNEDG